MKLDRNVNETGQGKYALLKMRELRLFEPHSLNDPSPVRRQGPCGAVPRKPVSDIGRCAPQVVGGNEMTALLLTYFEPLAYALIALIATGMLGPTNMTNPSVQIQGRRG